MLFFPFLCLIGIRLFPKEGIIFEKAIDRGEE